MRWRALPQSGSLPIARSSHTVTVMGDKLYLFGGEHDPRVPVGSELFEYSFQIGEWKIVEAKGEAPSPRVGHTAAAVDGKLYIFGGRSGLAMGEGAMHDLYCFDPATSTWTQLQATGDIPPKRSYHAMATLGRRIFVFGGCGAEGRLNDLYEYDTTANRWTAMPAPPADAVPPRGGSCLVAAPHGLPGAGGGCGCGGAGEEDGELYVVGGFCGKELDDMHVFRLSTRTWCGVSCPSCSGLLATSAPNALPARSVFGTVVHGACGKDGCELAGGLLVYGGEVDPSAKGHDGAGDFCSTLLHFRAGAGWKLLEAAGSAAGAGAGAREGPGPRGWFACDALQGTHGSAVGLVLHGGLDGNNERLGDMYVLEHES